MKQKIFASLLSLFVVLGMTVVGVSAQTATPVPTTTPRPASPTPTPAARVASPTPRPTVTPTPSPSPTATPRATTTSTTSADKGDLPTSGAWETVVLFLMAGCGILGLASYAVLRKKA